MTIWIIYCYPWHVETFNWTSSLIECVIQARQIICVVAYSLQQWLSNDPSLWLMIWRNTSTNMTQDWMHYDRQAWTPRAGQIIILDEKHSWPFSDMEWLLWRKAILIHLDRENVIHLMSKSVSVGHWLNKRIIRFSRVLGVTKRIPNLLKHLPFL